MNNQIIIAMDNEIPDGIRLISKLRTSEQVYGYKIGSLWILDRGMNILKSIRDILNEVNSSQKIILDMQKWGTDIPDIIKKQVEKVAPYVDELICCPMGAGSESLKMFAKTCIDNNIKPICVLEMTHPKSESYLDVIYYYSYQILDHALSYGITDFVIPATKEPKIEIKKEIYERFKDKKLFEKKYVNFYATGFKTQGGQTKPMVDFGVTKFIVGRAVYESPAPISQIELIYKEINEV